MDPHATHEVFNQPPPFEDVNLYATDAALQEAVAREGGGSQAKSLNAFGLETGSAAAFERGRLTNEHTPLLKTHDARGRRLDMVEFHPAYHALMQTRIAAGLASGSWGHLAGVTPGAGSAAAKAGANVLPKAGANVLPKAGANVLPKAGANVVRAAGLYMAAQMEAGHCCPITMTNACVPVVLRQPDIAEAWLPKILSRSYDPNFAPLADKAAVTLGMGMTEKQGGTDVRANTTTARPAGARRGAGADYILTGHKWFLSAPMSDAFLMLAQAQGGLSCFLVPRFLPDGSVNALRLQRLKPKLGNRSNASSEVELAGAHGFMIEDEGRGVATILEMVTYTRLDCAVSSAGLMRLALAHAIHHCENRTVFQKRLADQPLMSQVLADMALDVEAATALAFRLARAFDCAGDARAAAWLRLMTPVTKYFVCKMAPPLVAEAMECLGGSGYVEELPLARLYREVPVNAIWEGSGNVMALDVLRVLQREPEVAAMVMEELGEASQGTPQLKALHQRAEAMLSEPRYLDSRGRALVETLATLAAGTILKAHAPAAVADAWLATRGTNACGRSYGQALEKADVRAILARATPNK